MGTTRLGLLEETEKCLPLHPNDATIAQLVEHFIRNEKVASSSLACGSPGGMSDRDIPFFMLSSPTLSIGPPSPVVPNYSEVVRYPFGEINARCDNRSIKASR